MAVYGKKLIDNEGNTILPKTRSNLVYMSDDNTVEDTITKIKSGEIVVGKSADTNKLLGRTVNLTSSDGVYVAPNEGDPQKLGCVPYCYSVSSGGIVPNRFGDGVNNFGLRISLEAYADSNVFFWDSEKQKTVRPKGIDDTKMPLTGGTFTGWVTCGSGFTTNNATYFQGANNFGGTATFNNNVHLGGQCSIAQDKSPGNGTYVQPAHIPNISQNIRYIIYWT